jgi:hemoglobin
MSIYDQIGGGMTVSAVVDRFNRRLLADVTLAPQYHGVEVHRLAGQQRAYLTAALGGPQNYFGGPVSAAGPAYAGMDDATVAHLSEALREFGVPVEAVSSIAEDLRPHASRRPPATISQLTPPPAPAPIRPELPNTAPVAGRRVAA